MVCPKNHPQYYQQHRWIEKGFETGAKRMIFLFHMLAVVKSRAFEKNADNLSEISLI